MVQVQKLRGKGVNKEISLYFQRGRVCQINFGPLAGKICVIIDFVDQARALVDGPFTLTGVNRQTMPYRRLSLTNILLKIPRSPLTPKLIKLCKEQEMLKLWEKHAWRKREVRLANKQALSDFDRFKISKLKLERHAMIKERLKIVDRNHKWRKKTLSLFRRPQSESKRPRSRVRKKLKKEGKWPPEDYAREMTDEHKKAIAQWRADKKEKLKKIRKFRNFKSKIVKQIEDKKRKQRQLKKIDKNRKKNKERLAKRGAKRLKEETENAAARKKAATKASAKKHRKLLARIAQRKKVTAAKAKK